MCVPVKTIQVDKAVITARVAQYLGCMQANNNEDILMMLDNIAEMKRFFISLQGRDVDANELLGYLGYVQYIEDNLKELMYDEAKNGNGEE